MTKVTLITGTSTGIGRATALYMARIAALAWLPNESTAGIDRAILEREVNLVSGLVQQFAAIQASHSRAEKAIGTAKTCVDALRTDIVAALHRIEAVIRV